MMDVLVCIEKTIHLQNDCGISFVLVIYSAQIIIVTTCIPKGGGEGGKVRNYSKLIGSTSIQILNWKCSP